MLGLTKISHSAEATFILPSKYSDFKNPALEMIPAHWQAKCCLGAEKF